MSQVKKSWSAAVLAVLGLTVSACSCEGDGGQRLAPQFALEGPTVGPDSRGEADFEVGFGTITVGSRHVPEVTLVNKGNTTLTVRLASDQIEAPFSLASGTFELRPKTSRPIEFSLAPDTDGDFETIVEFDTNEPGRGKRRVRLVGSATQSRFVCDPVELDLGHVVVGEFRTGTVSCTNHLDIPTTISLGDFIGAYSAYFRAEIQGLGDGRTAEIPAGATVSIEVRFTADGINGIATATLPLIDPSGQIVQSIHVNATAVDYALQVGFLNSKEEFVPLSGCYDFPDTDVEDESFASLYVRNVSRNPVAITKVFIDGDSSDFYYVGTEFPPDGKTVAPDGQELVELALRFAPVTAKSHVANVVIEGKGTRATPFNGLRACIQGQGGGARISCTPAQINFGPVAFETAVTRSYKCTNSAVVREGAKPQILYVSHVEIEPPFSPFTAAIREVDGEPGPNDQGYLPGESFWVDVTYAPVGPEESLDSAKVIVHNTSTATPGHETPVSGMGRDLPPCDFEIAPSSLRFGVVNPGTQRTLTAYVINRSETHECIISNLHLTDDTHTSFSMEMVESVIVPPRPTGEGAEGTDYRYPIQVTFAPTEIGAFEGAVEFYISDPSQPKQRISLSGLGRRPCLEIDPGDIDFGAAPPMCAGREVVVSIRNACTTDVTIDSIEIDEAYPWFHFAARPLTPLELPKGDQIDFQVYFQPDDIGGFEGAVTIEVTPLSSEEEQLEYIVPLHGRGQHDAIQTDTFSQLERPKVDVLWVIDNSGSMFEEQTLLKTKIPLFMKFAIEQNVDFHLGVTTTGITPSGSCPGGFNGGENGRLFPSVSEGRPRLLKSTMPKDELMAVFAQNVLVGTCHGTEPLLEAAKRALSDPWINTPLEQDGNMGFLRRDAALSIIGVTDEDDSDSPDPVPDYVDFFQKLKPTSADNTVKVHMISGGETSCSSSMGSASACPRCIAAAEMTGGLHIEICMDMDDPRWDEAFLQMSEGAFGYDSAFRLRGEPADPNAIEVRVNGRLRERYTPNGALVWYYNPDNGTVAFTPLYIPGPSQVIEVTYEVACKEYDLH